MKKLWFIIAIILLACSQEYPNFKQSHPGTYYKLLSIGEEEFIVADNAYIALKFNYCEDEICYGEYPSSRVYTNAKNASDFWLNFHLGDEVILLLDSTCNDYWKKLFQLENKKVHWPLIARFKVMALYDDFEYSGSPLLIQNLLKYRESCEIEIMKNAQNVDWEEKSGCFISTSKEGNGDTVVNGREITIEYKAYFSNGYRFDDTDKWEDSLTFIHGLPDQIIEGLEIGIEGLREGAETKLIIPSQLAFGKQGSSSGIVPPFEPLLYEIKVLSVTHQDL